MLYNKIIQKTRYLASAITAYIACLLPYGALASFGSKKLEYGYKADDIINNIQISSSPILGMVGYTLLAIIVFAIGIMVTFFLVMLLKR